MKIFISSSGKLSHEVALKLKKLISLIIPNVDCFISEDIDKGSRWGSLLAKKLEEINCGIFCVTKNNINSPWLNFEAGAISKFVEKASVYTFLYDINRSELKGPLDQFQATKYEKEDILKLIKSINTVLGVNIKEHVLESNFNTFWELIKKDFDELEGDLDLDENFDFEGKLKGLKDLNIGVVSNSIFDDLEHFSSIDILATTSSYLFDLLGDRIEKAVKNGCNVRFAISSPNNSYLKSESVRVGLCKNSVDLIGEINRVINQLQKMIIRLKDENIALNRGSLQVRTYLCAPTCGIIILNNEILRHTPYLPYSQSTSVPTFDIINQNGSKLFEVYKETFIRVWENSDHLLGTSLN